MIRIMLVDDHPAMRAGLTGVLTAEPGMVPLGAAASAEELLPVLKRTRPDLVLLDYHLPGTDGLALCRRLKREIPAPSVLLYSAYADAQLAVPAILAGADGYLLKSISPGALIESLKLVTLGEKVFPSMLTDFLGAMRTGQSTHERVRVGDVALIDGGMVNGSARVVGWLSGLLRNLQSGYLYHYAFAMVIGLSALLAWYVLR